MQNQFDWALVAKEAAGIVVNLVTNIFNLRPVFDNEDIEILCCSPLERFGNWLMVDGSRLDDGKEMLERVAPPKLWGSSSLSLIIGLYNDKTHSVVKIIRDNDALIAATLFLQVCSTGYLTQGSTTIFFELMKLTGISKAYPFRALDYNRFVEALNGCQEYMVAEKSAKEFYNEMAEAVRAQDPTMQDQTMVADIQELAKIIYEAFEGLQNADNNTVVLLGSRHGVWLAVLLAWLRPQDVIVLVKGTTIFPRPQVVNQSEPAGTKLHVRLGEAPRDAAWVIQAWTTSEGSPSTEIEIQLKDMNDTDSEKQLIVPLDNAKCQIATQVSNSKLGAIGHLATALVCLTMEHGQVHGIDRTWPCSLSDVCSTKFTEKYSYIMSLFGWRDGDLEKNRVENTVEALDEALQGVKRQTAETDERYLEHLIEDACRKYPLKNYSAMLLDRQRGEDGPIEDLKAVIDYAIYLAGESLMFALCADIPPCMNCRYRPFDPLRFQEHTVLLSQLLQRPFQGHGSGLEDQQNNQPSGFSFWELRRRTMEMLVPGAPSIQVTDLAVAGNGYVAFSAVFEEWDRCLTDRKSIASIYLAPGPLKARNVDGALSRLTENQHNPTLASRLIGAERVVTLFEGKECRLDERAAVNQNQTSITHMWHMETAMRTMQVATYVKLGGDGGVTQRGSRPQVEILVPTSWKGSIDALVFAEHVVTGRYLPRRQLKELFDDWTRKKYLSRGLQWCPVGYGVVPSARYIATTGENELLRFFEAGNLAHERRIFVKHRGVSLFDCVKMAMEDRKGDAKWIIIA